MASPPRPQTNNKMVDPLIVLVFLFFILAICALLWSRFHTQIATFYSWVRMGQFSVFWMIGEAFPALSNPFHGWFKFFAESDRSLIEWRHMAGSSLLSNVFTTLFVTLPFAFWIIRKSLKMNPYNHKHYGKIRAYSLHTYTDRMAQFYPHLKLFRKINLTARSINHGKYRMAATEKEFAIRHKLLDRVGKGEEFKINRDRAMDVFRGQLDRLWTGFSNLTPSEYAVIAALVPRIAATDPEMSEDEYKSALKMTDDLLAVYWHSCADSYEASRDNDKSDLAERGLVELDLEMAKRSIKRYARHPRVARIIKTHAYVATVIYAMLQEARTLGVLAANELRWLRVTNRRLWLTVNNVGRIVAFSEVAGIYSHYLHEVRQKRAIERPQVDAAVKALHEGVDSYKFTEDEVEAIKAGLDKKAEPKIIDMDALDKGRKSIILAAAGVGRDSTKELFEVALVAEDGNVLFGARCKPTKEIDEESRRAFALDEAELVEIVKMAQPSGQVCDKVLELCNGHRVVLYNESAMALLPGLDRSAAELVYCAPVLGEAAPASVYDAAATLQLGVAAPPKKSALADAQACREIWIELQKRALKAKQKKSQ